MQILHVYIADCSQHVKEGSSERYAFSLLLRRAIFLQQFHFNQIGREKNQSLRIEHNPFSPVHWCWHWRVCPLGRRPRRPGGGGDVRNVRTPAVLCRPLTHPEMHLTSGRGRASSAASKEKSNERKNECQILVCSSSWMLCLISMLLLIRRRRLEKDAKGDKIDHCLIC